MSMLGIYVLLLCLLNASYIYSYSYIPFIRNNYYHILYNNNKYNYNIKSWRYYLIHQSTSSNINNIDVINALPDSKKRLSEAIIKINSNISPEVINYKNLIESGLTYHMCKR